MTGHTENLLDVPMGSIPEELGTKTRVLDYCPY